LLDACESTNRVKNGVIKELFSENRGFSCEERVIYDITGSKDIENVEKDRKFLKIMVDD